MKYIENVEIDSESILYEIQRLVGLKANLKQNKNGIEVNVKGKIIFDFQKGKKKLELFPEWFHYPIMANYFWVKFTHK